MMIELLDLREDIPEGFTGLMTRDAVFSLRMDKDAAGIGISADGVPAGVVSARPLEGAGRIEYIFVDERYRRRGFATELIYRLGLLLSTYGDVYRMEAEYTADLENGLDELFTSLDFQTGAEDELGEYTISLREAANLSMIKKAKDAGAVPFCRLPREKKKALLARYDVPMDFYFRDCLDQKLSCVVETEADAGDWPACFFGKEDGRLILLWAQSGGNPAALFSMLASALTAAEKQYDENTPIRLPYINTDSKGMIEKLTSDNARRTEVVKNAVISLV